MTQFDIDLTVAARDIRFNPEIKAEVNDMKELLEIIHEKGAYMPLDGLITDTVVIDLLNRAKLKTHIASAKRIFYAYIDVYMYVYYDSLDINKTSEKMNNLKIVWD